jgi:hypothetical protein
VDRLWWLVVLVAGCAPDYDTTAFRCDTDRGGQRGCPTGQTCQAGRCRRGAIPASVIGCMAMTCITPDEQCCIDDNNPPRCVPAGDVCPGISALCDGRADCAGSDLCCSGTTTACSENCELTACVSAADCPAAEPHCCDTDETPWGLCTNDPC